MTLHIFGAIGSRASRCIWVAEECGVSYSWTSISTLDGSNRTPEYLAINPSGKIPAMTDGPVRATESMAINLYIAMTYGAGELWPVTPADQAQALQWSFWSATEIEYYIGALYPHLVMKRDQADPVEVARLIGEMTPKLAELERHLDGRDYILGDFSIADVNVAVQTFTMQDKFGLTLQDYPGVAAWTARCRARPARQKVETMLAAASR